ncbi:cytochrome b [Fertoebacter nigrum]|uniref:Cytochrome b n=1 Tax=Fertoeibacter niger TaxID=2656921 RepID=A0A8X8KRN9_9RHOB|nr:cytochrome b [Fertoeibacter niger]NUB45457.1 cytochrome b [Fertoeibacter niger]
MHESPLVYKPAARFLHWLMALLVIATIPIGVTMLQPGLSRGVQDTLFILHKNGGVVILLLLLARIAYRIANPPPPLPAHVPHSQRLMAEAVHLALYALLLIMAVSGFVRVSAGGFPIEALDALGLPRLPKSEAVAAFAKAVHANARYALVALMLAHIGAALYHGLVRKDGVLARMWPARRG